MSYLIGGNPKTDVKIDKEVHSIPCKLTYTGPAPVSEKFIHEVVGEENVEHGAFRGRGLEGGKWKAPDGFEIHVLKERKGPKGKMLDIECKKESITIWEWDRTCGKECDRTSIARASAYLPICQALADA